MNCKRNLKSPSLVLLSKRILSFVGAHIDFSDLYKSCLLIMKGLVNICQNTLAVNKNLMAYKCCTYFPNGSPNANIVESSICCCLKYRECHFVRSRWRDFNG